jgi:hypothetical protein
MEDAEPPRFRKNFAGEGLGRETAPIAIAGGDKDRLYIMGNDNSVLSYSDRTGWIALGNPTTGRN